jgi:subtilase family serine protease
MSRSYCVHRRIAAALAVVSCAALLASSGAQAETPKVLAHAASVEPTVLDVYFPVQHQAALDALIAAQSNPTSPQYRKFITPQQFRELFGPPDSTVEAVAAQLHAAGLTVAGRSALGLHVTGNVGAVEAAFGTRLSHARFADASERLVAEQPLILSGALAASGARVPQFSTVPPLQKHLRVLGSVPDNFQSTLGGYYTADLRQAYDFPSILNLNGQGVTIGILISGDYSQSDLDMYWTSELQNNFALQPNVTSIPVNGGAPYSASNSGETMLDVEQSSGIALGANVTIYNMSDLDEATVLYGLTRIVEDNKVDVVNMSFGGPEVGYLAKNNSGVDGTWMLQVAHALFQAGNVQGITFVASSGDHGAIPRAPNCVGTVCVTKPTLATQTPASDPNVTAVGGTNLVTVHVAGSNNSAYVSENAQPDPLTGPNAGIWGSGGGISVVFAKPAYQNLVVTPSATFRTVPDLALHMGGCQAVFGSSFAPCGANRSADTLALDGSLSLAVGTSAAAPDIAGMFALMVKRAKSTTNPSGRLGNMNTYIYTEARINGAKAFHHANIAGSNGHYVVKAPYDAVIGNGTVDARQFMGLTSLPASGFLGSASNP